MSRRDLVRELVESMPDQVDAVEYPDHPFLLRGPDVLAGADEGLVAYFAYTGSGARPGSAGSRARTLLSRLALPQMTTFVLVTSSGDTLLRSSDLDLFDAVQVGAQPGKRLSRRWERIDDRSGALVDELRPFHLQRFSDAWATRRDGIPKRPAHGIPTSRLRSRRTRPLPFGVDEAEGELFAPLPGAERSALMRRASQLVTAAVDLDYAPTTESLVETVGALRSRDAYLALHHATAPLPAGGRLSDAFKPYRAAAFAGFHTKIPGV